MGLAGDPGRPSPLILEGRPADEAAPAPSPAMLPADLDIFARTIAHLPFVRAVVDQLGLLERIEERCPTHKLNRVSDAQCVLALILNVLCGRPALYRMDEWLARLDTDVLFGEGIPADAFNDTRPAAPTRRGPGLLMRMGPPSPRS